MLVAVIQYHAKNNKNLQVMYILSSGDISCFVHFFIFAFSKQVFNETLSRADLLALVCGV